MIEEEALFHLKKPVPERLIAYGFQTKEAGFTLKLPLKEEQFQLQVEVDASGMLFYAVIDEVTGEEYTLIHSVHAQGNFIAKLRQEVSRKLKEIASVCFAADEFRTEQASRIIQSIEQNYGVRPEYLWEGSPASAALRHQETLKWFGVLMRLDYRKLDPRKQGQVEILVLKALPEQIAEQLGHPGFYRAFHMNKKHWITVVLDGTLEDETIQEGISQSFALTAKAESKRPQPKE